MPTEAAAAGLGAPERGFAAAGLEAAGLGAVDLAATGLDAGFKCLVASGAAAAAEGVADRHEVPY